jgi:hypothetical protein
LNSRTRFVIVVSMKLCDSSGCWQGGFEFKILRGH